MNRIDLNGKWTMVYGSDEEKGILKNKALEKKLLGQSFETIVPTTMYETLENNKVIDNIFFRENESIYNELSNIGCSFLKEFTITNDDLKNDYIEINFQGLDTLSTIYINDMFIGETANMHSCFIFSIKDYLKEGSNSIRVNFESPVIKMREKYDKKPIWTTEVAMKGHSYLRKSHTQFGWDWGPQFPDMGIWRPVFLKLYNVAKITDYYVEQHHSNITNSVRLKVDVDCSIEDNSKDIVSYIEIQDQNNKVVAKQTQSLKDCGIKFKLSIDDPHLWWPNNLGSQYLYRVSITIKTNETVLDSKSFNIGLRTLTLDQSPRDVGRNFAFVCNGVEYFSMGANYIPMDALAARGENKEKITTLLEDCKLANYNCIRVWGGGTYPSDFFYQECDRLGLVVWQDMMFACGIYDMSESFTKLVNDEIIYNVKRFRNHASLGLLCGNNEMEGAFCNSAGWGITRTKKLDNDYLYLYEKMIPDIMEKISPATQYWPSSPSSIGSFNDPENDSMGDSHYWGVFHGNEHYKIFRTKYLRFASEYGMESLADMKTIKQFTNKEDRSFLSPVMDFHNKVIKPYGGNMKVLSNIALEFEIPTKLDELSYISQVFQAATIKIAVEHFRSNRGRCMGSTYWQVNDDYPVTSWSSIDYYGRWKALHYEAKRFYSPIILASREDGLDCYLTICNESANTFDFVVVSEVRDKDCNIIETKTVSLKSYKFSSQEALKISISNLVEENGSEKNDLVPLHIYDRKEREYFVNYKLLDTNENIIYSGTQLFCPHKYFKFNPAEICIKKTADDELSITTDVFTKSIMITTLQKDVLFDDNCFDLLPGNVKTLKIIKGELDINDLKAFCINNLSNIS